MRKCSIKMDILDIRTLVLLMIYNAVLIEADMNDTFLKTWYESARECNLATIDDNITQTSGWVGGIRVTTSWMFYEGCYWINENLTAVHNLKEEHIVNKKSLPICSLICENNERFGLSGKRCLCLNDTTQNLTSYSKPHSEDCNLCRRDSILHGRCGSSDYNYYSIYSYIKDLKVKSYKTYQFNCMVANNSSPPIYEAVGCDEKYQAVSGKDNLTAAINMTEALSIIHSDEYRQNLVTVATMEFVWTAFLRYDVDIWLENTKKLSLNQSNTCLFERPENTAETKCIYFQENQQKVDVCNKKRQFICNKQKPSLKSENCQKYFVNDMTSSINSNSPADSTGGVGKNITVEDFTTVQTSIVVSETTPVYNDGTIVELYTNPSTGSNNKEKTDVHHNETTVEFDTGQSTRSNNTENITVYPDIFNLHIGIAVALSVIVILVAVLVGLLKKHQRGQYKFPLQTSDEDSVTPSRSLNTMSTTQLNEHYSVPCDTLATPSKYATNGQDSNEFSFKIVSRDDIKNTSASEYQHLNFTWRSQTNSDIVSKSEIANENQPLNLTLRSDAGSDLVDGKVHDISRTQLVSVFEQPWDSQASKVSKLFSQIHQSVVKNGREIRNSLLRRETSVLRNQEAGNNAASGMELNALQFLCDSPDLQRNDYSKSKNNSLDAKESSTCSEQLNARGSDVYAEPYDKRASMTQRVIEFVSSKFTFGIDASQLGPNRPRSKIRSSFYSFVKPINEVDESEA